jgi:3-hydroxy acid dehydrogenase/malonic semialdehyde reductase
MMKDNFPWATGRTALVTGATSGFGRAVALRLLRAGARVIATGRRQDRLDELAAEAKTQRLFTLVHDVSAKGSGEALLTALPQDFAAIDILFNNAGLALGVEPAQKASLDNWETMIETNVAGLVRVAHAVLPGMVERGRGHIINVSSVAASYPYPGGNVYGGTKAFARQFSLGLRADLIGTPVKVTSLEPGACETEFSQVRFAGDKDKAAAVYAGMQPLSAEDVADTVEAVLRLPEHLNVNTMEIMPVAQAFSPFAMARNA